MRYWPVSMMALSEYRSKSDLSSPKDRAVALWTMGQSCLWSPTSTTCFTLLNRIMGTRLSGSLQAPQSSMIICITKNVFKHLTFLHWNRLKILILHFKKCLLMLSITQAYNVHILLKIKEFLYYLRLNNLSCT